MPDLSNPYFMDIDISEAYKALEIKDYTEFHTYTTHRVYYYGIELGFIQDYEYTHCQFFHCNVSKFPNKALLSNDELLFAVIIKIVEYCRETKNDCILFDFTQDNIGSLKTKEQWLNLGLRITVSETIVHITV